MFNLADGPMRPLCRVSRRNQFDLWLCRQQIVQFWPLPRPFAVKHHICLNGLHIIVSSASRLSFWWIMAAAIKPPHFFDISSAAGIVMRFDWRGQRGFQMAFYAQILQLACSGVDGLFLIDADEFLRPAGTSRLKLSAIVDKWLADPCVGAVALNWAIYGSSNRVAPGEGLVIERFTHRAAQDFQINHHAKALVKPTACAGPADHPHAVALHSGRYIDTRGDDVV